MAVGECSAFSSLTVNSKIKFAAWLAPAHIRSSDASELSQWLNRWW